MPGYLRSCSLLVQTVSGYDTTSAYFCRVRFQMFKYQIIIFVLLMGLASCDSRDELAKVSHRFSGCFGDAVDELTIYKTGGKFTAVLERDGVLQQSAVLSQSQLDSFRTFVADLRKFKAGNGLCTTVAYYKVVYNNSVIKRRDGSCEFVGFDRLRRTFFKSSVAQSTPPANF